jgi:type IV secretory pathway TrbD component
MKRIASALPLTISNWLPCSGSDWWALGAADKLILAKNDAQI